MKGGERGRKRWKFKSFNPDPRHTLVRGVRVMAHVFASYLDWGGDQLYNLTSKKAAARLNSEKGSSQDQGVDLVSPSR